ncbi:TetR/AcrR family transcriptional regulator [Agromyces sp. SYSU T00194]|uniref:TetR/AcrR family transcriptional regulator n=1 Tax=Agromyces chitinivorans TaxID=3158560 RepID=UPI003395C9BB
MSAPTRPLRRDAALNRERLLDEAERYFAEAGIDASLHELAERTGVGIGTLYRRFPTYPDLIRALYDRAVERIDVIMGRIADLDSGWEQVVGYLDGNLAILVDYPATPAVLHRMSEFDPDYRPGGRWEEAVTAFVRRAHDEGTLRTDVTATDIGMLPLAMASVLRFPQAVRGVALARFRTITLDGLRAVDGTHAMPTEPLTAEELNSAIHERRADPPMRAERT